MTKGYRMPLDGIVVLDFTASIAGPFCTMLLADLGAEVIKVEKTKGGDDFRNASPIVGDDSFYFLLVNRNKKSIALDLKAPESRQIISRLASKADVVVENYRPGTAEKLGIDYTSLRNLNPKLVYCSISGFGQTGPWATNACYDVVAQAMSGLISVTGNDDKHAIVGAPISDTVTGLYAAVGILAALSCREKTGVGQQVELSMLDSTVSIILSAFALYFGNGISPRPGFRGDYIVPFGEFQASDGPFIVEIASDGTWDRFCKTVKAPELLDSDFTTIQGRVKHKERLLVLLNKIFGKETRDYWTTSLTAAGVPCGPILTIAEAADHPQIRHREMVIHANHPRLGTVKLFGFPLKFEKTPLRYNSVAPSLGQHTKEILDSLGFDDKEITEFLERKIAR